MPIIFGVMIVGGYSQVYRYRHTGALERQQIKWVALALVLFIDCYVITGLLFNLSGLGDPRQSGLTNALIYQIIIITIYNLTFIGIPIAIVVSILRYRLWDIDVIIRRTLVYGALIALGLVFLGAVTLLQAVFSTVIGQQSAISVVISTLLIAALFSPLRPSHARLRRGGAHGLPIHAKATTRSGGAAAVAQLPSQPPRGCP